MNDYHDGIDQEDHLPDHTISLRQALLSCQQLNSNPVTFHPDSTQRARAASVSSERTEACKEFWKEPHIATVEASSISSHDFRRRYHNRNLPCIINGLDQTCFEKVTKEWRNSDGTIHRDWFRNVVGEDTMVPLQRQQEATELDEDGRAMECETRNVTMNEWIDLLTKESDMERSSLYLKDWHLVLLLRDRDSNHLPLYQCPQHFEHDLLNSLLTKCTKGDYRFCYWGPAKSTTTRHSDVLHSFSWSYNVAGTKEWTFYSPFDAQTCVVTQHAGECVFVPCQWQHQVVNLEETLSINHNWITTANIDQTWDCLVTEMETIQNELSSWGISSWESSESMLRGCAGIDVTTFFFMCLIQLLELLASTAEQIMYDENAFDVYRLCGVLRLLLEGGDLDLRARLAAVLESEDLALDALAIARNILESVEGVA